MILDGQQGLGLDAALHGGVKVGLAVQVLGIAVVVELVLQHVFGPAEAGRGAQVELALQVVLAARQNDEVLGPADFCNQRLQFWLVCIVTVKIQHVSEVTG